MTFYLGNAGKLYQKKKKSQALAHFTDGKTANEKELLVA